MVGVAKILVVDDEEKITRVVAAYLERGGYAVTVAHDGQEALRLAAWGGFALLVLDLMLPLLSGEEVVKRLRQQGIMLPIIMLTAKGSEEERILGLGLGADDYLVKPFSPRELVARVEAVLRRYQPHPGSTPGEVLHFAKGRLVIDVLRHEVTLDERALSLTATEYRLLLVMARSPGRVFSRGELLEVAQGELATGFDRTVDSHIKNLRQKLEDRTEQPLFIQTVYGVGYKFGEKNK
ncbi:MAG: response regulator transcription factor [Peptococcaceae bacterium]|nr:response regulator transcription factor [Peptococcaceae bacterium]